MKILYSCLSKSWGGMEMFTLTAVKQLIKRNISVDLLCAEESRIHIEANNLGLIVHPLKISALSNPANILRLAALIRKNKYDIVHTQASFDLWLLVPALKLLGSRIPLLLTKQVGSFIIKKDFLHRWIYDRLTFALAISTLIKKNLLETCPLTDDKVVLLHNGIDTNRFDPGKADFQKVRQEFGITENEILIGMMARFSPGKGHEEFLYAAKVLNEKYSNLKYLVVGEASRGEDDYAAEIKKLAVEYKLENLIFTGFRSDTPEILAAMDIFVFPSHAEAFGIALAEALAMGKPSVCSNADGVLDIAVDGETSLLFLNKNANDLIIKTSALIESSDLRTKFSIAARKRAIEFFDLEKLTNKVVEIYQNAISQTS
ncbi:MAG: glycosyltransferase family 4 protein [Ignavibacteriaceae bacterium]|nr:glycosyltransferase family 4 protein [Ignavibacteriaceae bacterium]